jgi:hypothetical protein
LSNQLQQQIYFSQNQQSYKEEFPTLKDSYPAETSTSNLQESVPEENQTTENQGENPASPTKETKVKKYSKTTVKLSIKQNRKRVRREGHIRLRTCWEKANKIYPAPITKPELYTDQESNIDSSKSKLVWAEQSQEFKDKFWILVIEKIFLTKESGKYNKEYPLEAFISNRRGEYIASITPTPLNWSKPYFLFGEVTDKVGQLDTTRLEEVLELYRSETWKKVYPNSRAEGHKFILRLEEEALKAKLELEQERIFENYSIYLQPVEDNFIS